MKKIIVRQTAALFLTLGIAACSGRDDAASVPPGKDYPVTMTYFFPMHPSDTMNMFADDAPGFAALKEKTGVTVQWRLIPGANPEMQNDQYNLMMASGDIADVVCMNVESLKKYPDAWLVLDDYIKGNRERYPNLNKYIYDDGYCVKYLAGSDKKIRVIPQLANRRIGSFFVMRGDLLEKYRMNAPVTLEDWHRALTAAKNDGKIPYKTRNGRLGLNSLLEGYMDCVKEDYFVEDGRIKYGVFDPRYKEAVEILRRWYAEGLIDPEYPSADTTRWWEAALRGDVFSTFDNALRLPAANLEFVFNQKDCPYRMTGVGPMQSPRTGLRKTIAHYPRILPKSAAISRTAKNPERILDFFEYCFSDEGYILMNFGIEGYTFEYDENGNPRQYPDWVAKVARGEMKHVLTVKDMPKNTRDELDTDYTLDREDHESLRQARDIYREGDFIREDWILSLSFTGEEREILAPVKTEIDTYRGEMLDKFIMGIEPMSRWDAFTGQIKKMNVQMTIDIYQAALDRLLK
jgi:putative aldouronate transport system substrate-binding protein